MKTLSIDGILIQKNEIENIENKEGKKWIKQTFLIDIGGEYNNRICFQLFGEEKVKLIEQYELGDKIEVFFNISSREFNEKWYTDLGAWKVVSEKITEATTTVDTNGEYHKATDLPF